MNTFDSYGHQSIREYMEEVQEAAKQQVGGTHYTSLDVQPWDVMEVILTPEEFIGYLKGNIIKYSIRQGRKEGSDDGGKALHYKAKLEEFLNRY